MKCDNESEFKIKRTKDGCTEHGIWTADAGFIRHRVDGPALECEDGQKEFWLNGKKVSAITVLGEKNIGAFWHDMTKTDRNNLVKSVELTKGNHS